MNNKSFIYPVSAAIAFILAINLAFAAPLTTDGGTSASVSLPATTESGTTAGGYIPATTEAGTTAGGSVPATTEAGTTAGGSVPATTDAGTTAGTAVTTSVPAPAVTGVTGGGSYYSSGGSSVTQISSSTLTASSCPLITSYMKMGVANDAAQVSKLQAFLRTQGFEVASTGIFDQRTEAAVKAFQLRHLDSIMGPWSSTRPTGFVYITTLKKINEIACGKTVALGASDAAVIAAYKKFGNPLAGAPETAKIVTSKTISDVSNILPSKPTKNDQIAAVSVSVSTSSNSAATTTQKHSVSRKFWNFIKSLF